MITNVVLIWILPESFHILNLTHTFQLLQEFFVDFDVGTFADFVNGLTHVLFLFPIVSFEHLFFFLQWMFLQDNYLKQFRNRLNFR